jgi:hypothetical protein
MSQGFESLADNSVITTSETDQSLPHNPKCKQQIAQFHANKSIYMN